MLRTGGKRRTDERTARAARTVDALRPIVIRCVRAELAVRVGHRGADAIAADICRSIAGRVTELSDRPVLAIMVEEIRHRMDRVRPRPDARVAAGPLDGIPEPGHTVLVLRIAAGLTVEESAQALGITLDAVRLSQHQALNLLRARQVDIHLPSPQ